MTGRKCTTDFYRQQSQPEKRQQVYRRTGLLYAFDFGLSPYISYSTSFEPNLQTNSGAGRRSVRSQRRETAGSGREISAYADGADDSGDVQPDPKQRRD